VARDEPLTLGVSDMELLDLRDGLMAGARALLEDEVLDPAERVKVARVCELAARQMERLTTRSLRSPPVVERDRWTTR
jgi:hypothetical protein